MAVSLLSHPRTLAVRAFNRVAIPDSGTCYVRGLLKPLKETIYPHYQVRKNRRRKGSSSKSIGTRVHKEVERWVKGKPNKRIHRHTKQIKDSLAHLKLAPLASEVPLLSVDGAYLTHSDLLCRGKRFDGASELVVVSLKTGYSRSAMTGQGRCRGPCGTLSNSQQTHHLLQLACEVYVMEHEYGIKVGRAIVLYAGWGKKREPRSLDLPQWAKQQSLMAGLHSALRTSAVKSKAVLPEEFIDKISS